MYVELSLFVLPSKVNVELVPNESVELPLVHLYEVGVVITPFTLSTTFNIAVLVSQLILVGTIVTTASGPVFPVAPVAPVAPVSPFSPLSPTYLDQVYELAEVGAVELVPT